MGKVKNFGLYTYRKTLFFSSVTSLYSFILKKLKGD